MKPHRTVTITKRMLKGLGACQYGRTLVRPFLPARISTDPEKNLALACKLADARFAHEGSDPVYWFHRTVAGEYVMPNSLLAAPYATQTQLDAWIVAQWLAWSADAILTKKGR